MAKQIKAVSGFDALLNKWAAQQASKGTGSIKRASVSDSQKSQGYAEGHMSDGTPIRAYWEIFQPKGSDNLVKAVKLEGVQFKGFQLSTLRRLYDPGTIEMVQTFLATQEEETEVEE